MGALPPGPRSLSLWANGPRHDMRHAAAGLLALWHRPPLRLPSGRAVSYVRRAILTCEALGASHFSQSKSKIRFCSDSMSGFAPVLSGFAPAPTPIDHIPDGAPEIHTLQGDARQLAMENQSYDIVFSNSVIEHVGDFQDQIKFAKEARRVGKRLWIQTPARSCPIEPHYLGPFIHWFPQSWHVPLARWASIRGLTKSASIEELSDIASNTRLLNKHEFESLFPDCDILTEKLLFIFPKSYIAIRKN